MSESMDIIALEAAEASRIVFSTIAELASAICEEHLDSWSQRMLEAAGIHMKVVGREHIKRNENYIVMSNRQSDYDIAVLYQALGIPMQMVAAKDIARIPFLAMASGKQILPVTIDGTRAIRQGNQPSESRRHTAHVTISAPIDPASCGPGQIDRLITVVTDAIGQHLPAPLGHLGSGENTLAEAPERII